MGAVEATGPSNGHDGPEASDDGTTQATSVAVVAASLVVWWPAVDLGAYGVIFFQQLLSLRAASTAVFLVSNGPLLARADRDGRKIDLRVRFGRSADGESRCSSRWSPLPLWCLWAC